MPIASFSLKMHGEFHVHEHFKIKEFKCKDGTDNIVIDSDLVDYLQEIRNHFKKPVIINSAYRTDSYNAKVGGAKKSYHIKGRAADIKITNVKPEIIADYAINTLYVPGVILYPNFVHIDTRDFNYHAKVLSDGKIILL